MRLDAARDERPCVLVKADVPRDEDQPVGFDGLGEDGQRARGVGGLDLGDVAHVWGLKSGQYNITMLSKVWLSEKVPFSKFLIR